MQKESWADCMALEISGDCTRDAGDARDLWQLHAQILCDWHLPYLLVSCGPTRGPLSRSKLLICLASIVCLLRFSSLGIDGAHSDVGTLMPGCANALSFLVYGVEHVECVLLIWSLDHFSCAFYGMNAPQDCLLRFRCQRFAE